MSYKPPCMPEDWREHCKVTDKKGHRALGAALSVELGEMNEAEALSAFRTKDGTYRAALTLIKSRRHLEIGRVWRGGKGNNICDVAFRRVRAVSEETQFVPSKQHLMLVEFVRLLPPSAVHAAWRTAQKHLHPDSQGDSEKSKRLNELYQSLYPTGGR